MLVCTQELELAASQQRSPGGRTAPTAAAFAAAPGPPIITQLQRQLAAAQAELARLRVQVEVWTLEWLVRARTCISTCCGCCVCRAEKRLCMLLFQCYL